MEGECMTVKKKKLKISMLLIATLIATLGMYVIWANVGPKNTGLAEAKQEFSFVHPAFAQSMSTGTTFLEQEAGIAIYLDAGQPLNLDVARSKLHIIEYNTSAYVVGSIAIPTNPSGELAPTEDAHCFVHKEGWIVVYYLNSEPTAKIIDWKWWSGGQLTGSMNKLQAGLEKMGTALGLTLANVRAGAKYYDFAYPSATKFLLVIKTQTNAGTSSFSIELPGNFTFYDESWSHYVQSTGNPWPSDLAIDGTSIDTMYYAGTSYGELPSPLVKDTFHTVSVSAVYQYSGLNGGCIVLEYKEP
jgi:hypothetical protein